MPVKGDAVTINYTAWDNALNVQKTGDVGNHTLKKIVDGVSSVLTNSPAEVELGEYKIVLTAEENVGDFMTVTGTSSTGDIVILPSKWTNTDFTSLNDVSSSDIQTAATASLNAYDPPTNAEMEARTVPSADYFDPANDVVANVTLVDTVTTNTDMRGTDSAATAANLATTDGKIDTIDTLADSLTTNLATADGKIDTIDTVVDTLTTNLATAEGKIDTVDTVVDTLTTNLASTDGKIDTVDTLIDSLTTAVSTIEPKVDIMDTVVDALAVTLAALDISALTDSLTAIDGKIDTMDAVADAIKIVTDALPDSGALTTIAQESTLDGVLTVSSLLNSTIEGTVTIGQALRIMLAVLAGNGVVSGSTYTFKAQNCVTDRVIATVASTGARTITVMDGE